MNRILTPREEEVMQILWKLKHAFVKEILAEIPEPKPPYNTVSSVVRKLDREGLVGHEAFGNTHRYHPKLKKNTYRRKMFGKLVSDYFSDSPVDLLSHFVKEEKIDVVELKELLDELKKRKK